VALILTKNPGFAKASARKHSSGDLSERLFFENMLENF
jgi:hypothetical protein